MASKTRNPGAAGTAAGAKELSQAFHSKGTLPQPPKPKQAASTRLSVADGQTTVGLIDVVDGRYRATDTRGKIVGTFKTQLDASRAFSSGRASQ